jgi:hypothetical protein
MMVEPSCENPMPATLDQTLELAAQLSIEQQDMLIDILQRRRVDQRREEIAIAAKASIADFHAGKLQPQSLDSIMHELRHSLHDDAES